MKAKIFSITIILVSYLLLPQAASAHLFGQPPFFKVNGVYSQLYHVPLTSLSDFPLPQDGAPDTYLVNQPISFAFDVNRLPAPPDVVEKTTFDWDFGDGSKGHGLSNTHTYTKIGSYLVQIDADDGTTPTPQLLESVLLNVVPDKNYSLPNAVIQVNGRQSKDPLADILHIPFNNSLSFDASHSEDKEASIKSYFWDFGDQKSSDNKTDQHGYPKDLNQVFIVLRVTDNKGFIADNFVEVQNGAAPGIKTGLPTSSPKTSSPPTQSRSSQLPYVIGGVIVVAGGYLMVRRSARGRGRGKHQ